MNMAPFMVYFVLWFVLYKALGFTSRGRRSAEWNCRLVTLFHGVFCLFASGVSAIIFGPWPLTDQGGKNTALEEVIVSVCLGYFLFDFAWCFFQPKKESPVMFVHHLISIAALSYVLATGYSGTELMGTIFGAEASNPFLQMRWFLKELGLKDTKLFETNNIVFVLVFFTFRIILGTWLLITTWLHPRPTIVIKLGGTVLYIVGWIFFYDIVGYILYFFKTKKMRSHNREDSAAETTVTAAAVHCNDSSSSSLGKLPDHCVANIKLTNGYTIRHGFVQSVAVL